MSRNRFLYICLVLAILFSGAVTPLLQPSVAVAAQPETPSADSPSGLSENLTPTLTASHFNDFADNNTHVASDWEVDNVMGDFTGPNDWEKQTVGEDLESITVDTPLVYSTTYWWRVRYYDSGLEWSEWSNETSFTTVAAPVAAFTADRTAAVVGQTITFTNSSSGGVAPLSYQWDFGDGTGSTDELPSHSYTIADTYTVVLTVTDSAAGQDTETKTNYITVSAGLLADFSADRIAVVTGQSVQFTDLSVGGVAPLTAWQWDFNSDNITDSTAQSPSHIYGSAGTYTVVLTVTDSAANTNTTTKTNYITVATGPLAAFSADRVLVALGQPVTLTNTSSGGVGTLAYQWDFNNDNITDSTETSPTYIYGSAGTYTVVLKVTDEATNMATETKTDYITVTTGLLADFSADKTLVALGESIQFTNLSGGGVGSLSYQWDFNNDNVTDSTAQSPTHIYSSAGTYTVVLTVTDAAANQATKTKANYILVNQAPNPPKNYYPANLAIEVSLTTMLQSLAFDDPGDTQAASQWQVTTMSGNYASPVFDSGTDTLNLISIAVPSDKLNYSTTYYWHVRHQDSQSAWSDWSSETSFTTRAPGPGADFSADATALIAGQSVQFTDASTGQIVSWQWDFGDGTTPTTWTTTTKPLNGKVSHTYAVAGTYDVSLTVTDSKGIPHAETKPGYINVFALPQAGFSASATGILLGDAISFTSLSTGGVPPLTYAWDFDSDGVVDSASRNPTYSYAAAGTYTVTLKVTDSGGNSATEMKTGYIVVGNAIAPHSIPPQGGTIQTADGQIAMTFPADAVAGGAIVSIEPASPPAATKLPGGYRMGSTCFILSAVDGEGKEILMFARLVTITVKYSDEDVAAAGGDLNDLVLAYYNEATGKWKVVDTTLNRTDKSLSVSTTHFSTWAIMAKTSSSGLASWQWVIIGLVAILVAGVVMWKLIPARRPYRTR